MNIAGREIGPRLPPYIVAEVSCNHCGKLENALALIAAAASAGADAVKFQAYTPDTITLNCDKPDFVVQAGPWKGWRLYELYTKTQTPFEWFPSLFRMAKEHNITAFASVFDRSSVDMLEKLDCPAYKIASMEIVDIPLIKYAAATGKPLIISTGMASDGEIEDALKAVEEAGGGGEAAWVDLYVALLQCVSGYPTKIEEANLRRLDSMEGRHHYYPEKGISDHTTGWEVPVAATALGASVIEKHLMLSWDCQSEDAAFSLSPDEFRQMCKAVRSIWRAMQPSEAKSEESSRQARRSLYVVEDMQSGDLFTEKNVRSIRPGYGMAPSMIDRVMGLDALCDISRGTALTPELAFRDDN